MEFDAEARKNKEKNRNEELNKNKMRKNFKMPILEKKNKILINKSSNLENNNSRKNQGKNKYEINFISQLEIEKKNIEELEKERDKEKNYEVEIIEPKQNKRRGKKAINNENKKTEIICEKSKDGEDQKEKISLKKGDEDSVNLATNRKLEFSDETVEKITTLLKEENKENHQEKIEIDDVLKKNEVNQTEVYPVKPKKEQKEKKKLKEIKPLLEGDFDLIINYEDILKKEKIENSDMILLLIEICVNALKYNLKKSNKSKLFWEEVFCKSDFSQIFKQFKPETLRKYWRLIVETQNVKEVIETTTNYAEKINNPNIK